MNRKRSNNQQKSIFFETIVDVRRVTKVVSGGRIFSFSVLAVVGDKNGSFGYGTGKSIDITEAKRKAINSAKKNITKVPLRSGRTVHHTLTAKYGATSIIIRPAVPGTGIVAGGSARVLFEAIGMTDVVAKIIGSSNKHTSLHAAIKALTSVSSLRSIAQLRSVRVSDIVSNVKKANVSSDVEDSQSDE
jgi:small subunit ribosomal protein S5